MPLVSIGNHQTNIDKNTTMYEVLDEINKIIPNEIVVQYYSWETGFIKKKLNERFTIYYKMCDYEAEQLTGNLTESDAERFLEGLLLAWNNPVRSLKIVK